MPVNLTQIEPGDVSSSVAVTNFPAERSSNITKSRPLVSDAAATEIAPQDATRIKTILHNESGVLFVNFGPTNASNTDYVYRLTPNSTLEEIAWQGRITAIKESGSSSVSVALILGD